MRERNNYRLGKERRRGGRETERDSSIGDIKVGKFVSFFWKVMHYKIENVRYLSFLSYCYVGDFRTIHQNQP